MTLITNRPIELADITSVVREVLTQSSITTGIALVNALHTTCAVLVNEYQSALMDDLMVLAGRLVPERDGFHHDDPRYSDCERGNAHSHLRTALLGRSVVVAVNEGDLTLGRYQSIIFAEFDGPRSRTIQIQVLGE